MRALLMVVSLLWVNAHAATLDGVDQIITEPATGRELLAMLDSPDTRKAGMYFILGVIEGHLVTQDRIDICLLDKAVTVEDLSRAVRKRYATKPFTTSPSMLNEHTVSADIINAVMEEYPCR